MVRALATLATALAGALQISAFAPARPSAPLRAAPLHAASSPGPTVVVVSPPAGLGETVAVRAACLGGRVRWFVVSGTDSGIAPLSLPPAVRRSLEAAGGSIDLAGCPAADLSGENGDEAAAGAAGALRRWIAEGGAVGALVATEDGGEAGDGDGAAARVAAREAAAAASGCRTIAVVPLAEAAPAAEAEGGLGAVLAGWMGQAAPVPTSMVGALGPSPACVVSHAPLFGLPETRPEACAFVGGPLRSPVLREEYVRRGVLCTFPPRNAAPDDRSSRLSVGEAVARLAVAPPGHAKQAYVASLAGSVAPGDKEWAERFATLQGTPGTSALFRATFSEVPSVERLTTWIATKWFPAVIKTYELASIRVGARPVRCEIRADGTAVEIIWQILDKDFQTMTVDARMLIEVSSNSITATRVGRDRRTQLKGEDDLVRRLNDAAVQAVEKGLATKEAPPKKKKRVVPKAVAPPPQAAAPAPAASGPRAAGARRSSERRRKPRSAPKSADGPPKPADGPPKPKE